MTMHHIEKKLSARCYEMKYTRNCAYTHLRALLHANRLYRQNDKINGKLLKAIELPMFAERPGAKKTTAEGNRRNQEDWERWR